MSFNYQRKIFGYECDLYGHLNNANYFHLFEEARTILLGKLNLAMQDLMKKNIHIYVIKAEIEYIKPIFFAEQVNVNTEIIDFNRVVSTWQQKIINKNKEICANLKIKASFAKDNKVYKLPKDFFNEINLSISKLGF